MSSLRKAELGTHPNPMRWRDSCPDCGCIVDEHSLESALNRGVGFDCPRCGEHFSREDFMAEADEKHQAQHHRHAKADLSHEEEA